MIAGPEVAYQSTSSSIDLVKSFSAPSLANAYEPVRAFTLIWRPALPHFGGFLNSPKMGKTVFLHAYPGTWV